MSTLIELVPEFQYLTWFLYGTIGVGFLTTLLNSTSRFRVRRYNNGVTLVKDLKENTDYVYYEGIRLNKITKD